MDELFELAALEAREKQPVPEPFPLAELVHDVVQKHGQEAGARQLELVVDGDPDLPLAYADLAMTERVLDNLIGNALRHGGTPCTVTLRCGHHERTGLPWLKVQDNGQGISEEAINYLFEPFYTTAKDGNGLGLYLCRELCHANQATLDLEETPKGASFVITFAHPHRQFQ